MAPGQDIDQGQKRQQQTSLAVPVAASNLKYLRALANLIGPASNTSGQSICNSVADMFSTYLDLEVIRIEE